MRILAKIVKWLISIIYKDAYISSIGLPEVCKIMLYDYGHHKSREMIRSVDKDGKPLPWLTYPAIEYLKQFDLSDKKMFEWGSGSSTTYFAGKVAEIHSVEENNEWFGIVSKENTYDNVQLMLRKDEAYYNAIKEAGIKYDIILIDGNYRDQCARIAPEFLVEDGMIILDNSDWFSDIPSMFNCNDFIQVDMHGLGPMNNYTWTTSFFLSRKFNFKSAGKQPILSIGGIANPNENPNSKSILKPDARL